MLARFCRDQRGNVALIFGLALIPLVGFGGAALDYARASQLKSYLSRETDNAALTIAGSDTPVTDAVLAALKSNVETRYGPTGAANVTVQASWVGTSQLTVQTNVTLASTLLTAMPGGPSSITVAASSQVTRKPALWQWTLPTISDLSYEAADYNRISVYCYDASRKADPDRGRRLSTLTAIADNGGTSYKNVALPTCNQNETMSYQLRNVRNSRTTKSNWDSTTAEHYLYFTDTADDPITRVLTNTITGGRQYPDGSITPTDLSRAPILETIRCANAAQCRSKSDGGILPNNHETGRTPATAAGGCLEGMLMYYGWEDRPPVNQGDSDTDYDDIRIVVSCPTLQKIADKSIRVTR